MVPFPHSTATAEQIESRAKELVGRPLMDLQPALDPRQPSSPRNKGIVGRIYEACFDIPPNSRAGPDFEGAGIELKSVPIHVKGGEAAAKERISLGMIDFSTLPDEVWQTAGVRRKLGRMLLIFYGWEPLTMIGRFRTLAAGLWEPDETSLRSIEADWKLIRDMVADGRRTDLSESLTKVLGAATKGPGHGSNTRAWSLKQPFVSWIYSVMIGRTAGSPTTSITPATTFEEATLARLQPHIGQSFDRLATVVRRTGLGGKNASASIVRAILGQRPHGKQGDFERFGVEIKVVPVDPTGTVIESMSFPAFTHEEVAYESWEDSDLLGRLNRLLVVPVHRRRGVAPDQMRMGTPFFWNPGKEELEGIQREWEQARQLIEVGRADQLPKASATSFIHVRPHGRDATDRELAPGGVDVMRRSFWLNQRFVERILAEHGALTRPPPR